MSPRLRPRRTSEIPVALWLSTATEKHRGIVRGLAEFAQANPRVRVYRFAKAVPLSPTALAGLGIRGVIAAAETSADLRALLALRRPFVNLTGQKRLAGVTTIRTDDEAVGRLAAHYFFRRGYRHLAYCGDAAYEGSILREKGMRLMSARLGTSFHRNQASSLDLAGRNPRGERTRIARWLRQLPRPVGIFVLSDEVCQHLVELCERAGLDVPDEVAVLGANIDQTHLALSSMQISSIELNTREIGRRAGQILLEIIEGRRRRAEEVLVRPLKIMTRRSTDRCAVEDRLVAEAVEFIREHAAEPISVPDVLRAVASSRRRLELRFRAALNRSVYAEIQRQHFDRALELMVEPERSLSEIAYESGFRNPRHLSVAFRTRLRITPGAFRRKLLAGRAGPGVLDAAFK